MVPVVPRNRIAELRRERGLSQQQLADELGVNASTVSRWEAGHATIPDPTKSRIAEIFSVSVPFLMGWDLPDGNGGNGESVAA